MPTREGFPADGRKHLATVIRRQLQSREEHVRGCDLVRLGRAPIWGVLTEPLRALDVAGGGDQWHTGPGATQLTRMPRLDSARAE
jgi:hypothetical protein